LKRKLGAVQAKGHELRKNDGVQGLGAAQKSYKDVKIYN
jgi:hypothetical protein